MKINITATAIIPAIALSMALVSCNKSEEPSSKDAAAQQQASPSVAVMEACFTETAPTEFVSIEEARKVPAKQKVAVKGTLLGRENIFLDNAAMFLIGDPSKIEIETGEEKPWIACCTPPEVIKTSTLTVQFVDDQGNVIRQSAKGVKGLKELDEVIISGEMDEASTPEAPILNIGKINIVKK